MSTTTEGRTPYTVRHRNSNGEKLESCFYASDAYEARLLAMEFNAYIKLNYKVGEKLPLTVLRKGKKKKIEIRLVE